MENHHNILTKGGRGGANTPELKTLDPRWSTSNYCKCCTNCCKLAQKPLHARDCKCCPLTGFDKDATTVNTENLIRNASGKRFAPFFFPHAWNYLQCDCNSLGTKDRNPLSILIPNTWSLAYFQCLKMDFSSQWRRCPTILTLRVTVFYISCI